MLMLALMVSHDQVSRVAPHFDHLEPKNAMVPLMTLSSSCDADGSANSVT